METSKFDIVADYLDSNEMIAEYLKCSFRGRMTLEIVNAIGHIANIGMTNS